MAAHRCRKEVAKITDDLEKPRPDVVIYRLTENTLYDVRTVVGGDSRCCRQAGQLPGFGAQWGTHEKNKKWLGRWIRQGGQFIPLVHEAGGTTGAPALDFPNTLAPLGGAGTINKDRKRPARLLKTCLLSTEIFTCAFEFSPRCTSDASDLRHLSARSRAFATYERATAVGGDPHKQPRQGKTRWADEADVTRMAGPGRKHWRHRRLAGGL